MVTSTKYKVGVTIKSMKKRRLYEKELKKTETRALMLWGTEKYHQIEKNHKRLIYLKKKLGIKNEPKRMSVASIFLSRMGIEKEQDLKKDI